MKKKLLAIGLAVAVLAVTIVGMSIAYFTDTDNATNTFTVGNVAIELKEEFDADTAVLRPGSQTTNAINKDVWIKNTGTEAAYVWYEWYIPSELDSTDGSTGTHNIVHVNSLGRTWDHYRENQLYWEEGQTEALPEEQTWDHDPEVELDLDVGPEGFIRTETIEGIQYNVYLVLYHGVLAPQQQTSQAMDQVYLDSNVDFNGTSYTINGDVIDYDFSRGVNIIVKAYGIQAAGFSDVYAAYNAYAAQYPVSNN